MGTTEATPRDSNRREFTRVEVELTVKLRVEDEWFETDVVRDISLNGLLLDFGDRLEIPAKTQVKVQMFVGGLDSGVVIEVLGDAARVEGGMVAVEISEIYGTEGFEHLKNLVRYNSSDAEEVDREFATHLGIKRP